MWRRAGSCNWNGTRHSPCSTRFIAIRRSSAIIILAAAFAFSARAESVNTGKACTLEAGPLKTVARIIDGETVALDDNSEVRLIGALAPRARDAGANVGAWPPETAAVSALTDLILGKKVRLAYGGRRSDRYGRALAHLFLKDGGGETWVQGAMLEGGHARAYGLEESFVCAPELLAHEAEARLAHRGLWSNGVYREKPAAKPGYLMTLRGRFERVTGKIRKVAITKSAIYLNFGADWRSDFTARIAKHAKLTFDAMSKLGTSLEGQTITVRGWIERRSGPSIDIADLSQLELPGSQQIPSAMTPERDAGPAAARPGDSLTPEKKRPAPSSTEPGAVDL